MICIDGSVEDYCNSIAKHWSHHSPAPNLQHITRAVPLGIEILLNSLRETPTNDIYFTCDQSHLPGVTTLTCGHHRQVSLYTLLQLELDLFIIRVVMNQK